MIAVALASLSVGWLVPLYLASAFYLGGFEILIRGNEGANSFPYFNSGREAFFFGVVWCTVSALAWATFGINRLLPAARKAPPRL
jgi:hypothetical protein